MTGRKFRSSFRSGPHDLAIRYRLLDNGFWHGIESNTIPKMICSPPAGNELIRDVQVERR